MATDPWDEWSTRIGTSKWRSLLEMWKAPRPCLARRSAPSSTSRAALSASVLSQAFVDQLPATSLPSIKPSIVRRTPSLPGDVFAAELGFLVIPSIKSKRREGTRPLTFACGGARRGAEAAVGSFSRPSSEGSDSEADEKDEVHVEQKGGCGSADVSARLRVVLDGESQLHNAAALPMRRAPVEPPAGGPLGKGWYRLSGGESHPSAIPPLDD